MTSPEVSVHADADALAEAAALELIGALVELQAAGGPAPRIALTGGGVGIAMLEHIRASTARAAVDWGRVAFYWGDERYLPPGDGERNEVQARAALLDHVPVDRGLVFPMGSDTGGSADAAAAEYAQLRPEGLDIVLLGMGEEGHTASVFPDSPAVHETARTVVAVYDCPKPPPTRISLTLPTIRTAAQVWVVAAGPAKADALAAAHGGAAEVDIPMAGARGTRRTRWLLDRGAASKLS